MWGGLPGVPPPSKYGESPSITNVSRSMGGGVLTLIFLLHILSSLVNVRLHTENWLCNLPGSALKVPGGGWWFRK